MCVSWTIKCFILLMHGATTQFMLSVILLKLISCTCGPGSSIGIAPDYGMDGSGTESRWGARFSALLDRPWGPPSLLYNGYQVLPGGKVRPGRAADNSPLLVPWSWKSRAIPLPVTGTLFF